MILACLNLILGILTLSYLHPKKDRGSRQKKLFLCVLFWFLVLQLLSLPWYASMCYLLFLTSLPCVTCTYPLTRFAVLAGLCVSPSLSIILDFREPKRKWVIVILPTSILVTLLGWYCYSLVSLVRIAIGEVLLLNRPLSIVSGIILSIELPSRCYSGSNEHFKIIGRACCDAITAMAICAWLGVLTSKSSSWTSENIHHSLLFK